MAVIVAAVAVAVGIVVHSAEDSLCTAAEVVVAAGQQSRSVVGEVRHWAPSAAGDSHSAAERTVVANRRVTDALCLRRPDRSWN